MKPSAADYYIPLCVCEGFHGGCCRSDAQVDDEGRGKERTRSTIVWRILEENAGPPLWSFATPIG